MSVRSDLFRTEAVEFQTRGETSSGGVIRLGSPWLRWMIRALLVLVTVGIIGCIFVRTEETTSGNAAVNLRTGRFVALLPAVVAPELRSARRLRLTVGDGRSLRVDVRAAQPVAAQTRIRGLPPPAQPSLLLSGRILGRRGGAAELIPAHAVVVLRSDRLGEIMLRQLRLMLGHGGGGA